MSNIKAYTDLQKYAPIRIFVILISLI